MNYYTCPSCGKTELYLTGKCHCCIYCMYRWCDE